MQLLVNGVDAFVATGGRNFDASQPTIVLLHGAGFDHATWALHSRWFAHHGYGVLAPDLPGHGRSSGVPLPAIADMADWTAALIDPATDRIVWRYGGAAPVSGPGQLRIPDGLDLLLPTGAIPLHADLSPGTLSGRR